MNIPEELIYNIIDYSEKILLIKLRLSNKNIDKYVCQNKFWYRHYINTFDNKIFNIKNQLWKDNYLSLSKVSKAHFKLLRILSQTKIFNKSNKLDYSYFNQISWIQNDKILMKDRKKYRIKTVVNNHITLGYFIAIINLINYDELYISVYFVNNSENYGILYKIDF
jgi:hypothetical protein